MRSLFFTWGIIVVVIGGLLLALICIGHRYFLHTQKQTVKIMTNRSRPVELTRKNQTNEETKELTSHDTEIN